MRDLAFDDLLLFVRIAALGTLSAAARERDVPVSQVSRQLGRIERACGARLLHRGTHGLALTDEGALFLEHCRRIGAEVEELEGAFASQTGVVGGTVRIAVSPVMALHQIVPELAGLHARHPGLSVDLQVDDRMVDMAREGIDIAIRTGEPQTDTVVVRRLGDHTRHLFAAPVYLREHGTPMHPDDLADHSLITSSVAPHLNHWFFVIDGHPCERAVTGRWRSSSTGMMVAMALAGLGIARINDLVAAPLVAAGQLVPVLRGFVDPRRNPIYAVMLPQRQRLPRIRACLDYWADWFEQYRDAGRPTPER